MRRKTLNPIWNETLAFQSKFEFRLGRTNAIGLLRLSIRKNHSTRSLYSNSWLGSILQEWPDWRGKLHSVNFKLLARSPYFYIYSCHRKLSALLNRQVDYPCTPLRLLWHLNKLVATCPSHSLEQSVPKLLTRSSWDLFCSMWFTGTRHLLPKNKGWPVQ